MSEALWITVLDAADVQEKDVLKPGEEHVKQGVPVPAADKQFHASKTSSSVHEKTSSFIHH